MRQRTDELMPAVRGATDADHRLHGDTLRQQVCAARRRQLSRAGCLNVRLPPARLATDCAVDHEALTLLQRAGQSLKLTGRGVHRLLRLARTIADLRDADDIATADLAEAIQLRREL
jgi:magnesium chelatase family protein